MPFITLTDAEIDARARAYASNHNVSYSEALNHIVSFAQQAVQSATPAAARDAAANVQSPMTDAQADAEAQRYAAQHGVDYLSALRVVLRGQPGAQAVRAPDHAGEQDRRLDAAAQAYARVNGVGYSQALDCVTMQGTAGFSEGAAPIAGIDAVRAIQGQPIEIFRAGTHVDNQGNSRTFTAQDIMAMARAYDPTRHEAPLVVGHPDANRPAYGWVKSLTATPDGRLLMLADRVDSAFADNVKASRYRKRSASFYPPFAPNNPAPGQWYLQHVGWLGAQSPAVKGLADVNFATLGHDGAVCFSDFS